MKTLLFFLAAGAAALAGCSTAVSPAKSAKIDPQKTGLVLASLNQTGPRTASIAFRLHRVDGPENSSRNLAIDSTQELTLTEVPVGRYELAGWTVTDGVDLARASPQNATKKFEFEVRPGEVAYLGHFEVVTKLMADTLNPSWVFPRSLPILEDRSAGTIEAFRQQYPALAAVPVRSVAPQRVVLIRPSMEQYLTSVPISPPETRRFDPMPTGPKWP